MVTWLVRWLIMCLATTIATILLAYWVWGIGCWYECAYRGSLLA